MSVTINPMTLQPIPSQEEATLANNGNIWGDYYNRLKLLALSMFEWEGLPETMSARFLEETLFDYGKAAIVKDDVLGVINLRCTGSETINIYGDCVSYHCYSTGYDKDFALDDMVLVRNNLMMIPTSVTLMLFTDRLYEAETTIETNIHAQKTPIIILCDDKERLSLENIYRQYAGNMPVIKSFRQFDPNSFSVLKTDAPFVADKVELYKKNVWSEAMAFLGINNIIMEKRAQLNSGEVDVNNQMIELSAQVMLSVREQASREMNEKYKLNTSVKMRTNWKVGDGYGNIYGTTEETNRE